MTVEDYIAEMESKARGHVVPSYEAALQECVPIVQEDIAQHFADRIDSDGQSWPAHSPATIAMYGAHPLLVLSGLLKAAAAERGYGSFVFVGADMMRYGVNKDHIPYAGVHQFGHGKIPAREYMYLSDEARRACTSIIAGHAMKQVA